MSLAPMVDTPPSYEPQEQWGGIPILYYVDLTPPDHGDPYPGLQEMKDSIESFKTWATSITEQAISEKEKQGLLKDGSGKPDAEAILRYRSRVLETVFRTRTVCLTSTHDFSISRTITSSTPNLESTIIELTTEGFPVTEAVKVKLNKVLESVVGCLRNMEGKVITHKLLATVFTGDKFAKTVDPKIRLITLETQSQTVNVPTWIGQRTEKQVTLTYKGSEWSFSAKIWDEVYKENRPSMIERGKRLMMEPLNVSID